MPLSESSISSVNHIREKSTIRPIRPFVRRATGGCLGVVDPTAQRCDEFRGIDVACARRARRAGDMNSTNEHGKCDEKSGPETSRI